MAFLACLAIRPEQAEHRFWNFGPGLSLSDAFPLLPDPAGRLPRRQAPRHHPAQVALPPDQVRRNAYFLRST